MHRKERDNNNLRTLCSALILWSLFMIGCANRVSPGGGPYDDTPPVLLRSTPELCATNYKGQKITLYFDEYIKVRDQQKRVIISPPQLQMPRISAIGKRVTVELQDTLIPNTTYTIDFTDAIVDNNEDNPLENFSFAFSTGDVIDTMEISGKVIDARTHEPIQNITVGLHPASASSKAFTDTTFMRMSRTSDRAQFVIRNVKDGKYRVYALSETDNNYRYDNPTEGVAFLDSVITTSSMAAVRNDTIWKDSLTIDTIKKVNYTRYLPDDIVLRYYTAIISRQFISKRERPDSLRLKLEFNNRPEATPTLRLPDVPNDTLSKKPHYVVDVNNKSVTFFLLDDSWQQKESFLVSYLSIDSLNLPTQVTDTLKIKRPKVQEAADEIKPSGGDQPVEINRSESSDEPVSSAEESTSLAESPTPSEPVKKSPLSISFERKGTGGRVDSLFFTSNLPLDTTVFKHIHLYEKKDSIFVPVTIDTLFFMPQSVLRGLIVAKLGYNKSYKLAVDTLQFKDMMGHGVVSDHAYDFKVDKQGEYSHLELQLSGVEGPFIYELLDTSDKVIRVLPSTKKKISFDDLKPGKYGVRVVIDRNGNGVWDPGDYNKQEQPEEVYYAPKIFELLKNWRVKENWAPLATPLLKQKPQELIRTKPEEKKKVDRNKQREEEMRNRRSGGSNSFGNFGSGLGGLRNSIGQY